MGPDGKIYLSSTFRNYISIIHHPNEKGLACQYEKQAITFPSGGSLLGIPTFPASYYAPGKPYIATTGARCTPLCRDSVQQYYVTGSCVSGAQYEWSATGGMVVQQAQDTAWVRWQQSGVQEVRVRKVWNCGDRSDTLRVEVKSCSPCVPVEVQVAATTCDAALVGVDTVQLSTVEGCDSLVITTRTLLPSVQTDLSATTCDPALAGVDTMYYLTTMGCDSLVITTWELSPDCAPLCPSGKEGNFWFFGDHIGLDFNVSPPSVLTGMPMNTYEASTIVSDADGNLLFYSNGEYIWDRNHQRMPAVNPSMGGIALRGHRSSTQILALPLPGSSTIFYLFYPEVFDNATATTDTLRKMYYSVIDMTQNGGLGDVIDKDHFLFEKTTEKVAATRHCNGEDWWVLTSESGSNRYFVWTFTPAGLSATPIVNSIGRINQPNGAGKGGELNFSPGANQILKIGAARISLAQPWSFDCYVELLEFDNATGAIYNPILIIDSVRSVYGGEFSPDNTKLYFNYWTPIIDSLYQYDLCVYQADSILASKTPIARAASNTGQFQLGPDGKIYISSAFRNYISIIHHPNEKGLACQYEKQAITFSSGESLLGIPTFPASYYAPGKPYIATTGARCTPLCRDSVQQYYVTGSCVAGAQYEWSATGGTVVQQQQDTAWVRWQQAGVQEVRVRKVWTCGDRSDTLRVEVKSCSPCVPVEVQVAATTCDAAIVGVDTVQLSTVEGCDSLVITTRTLLPSVQTNLNATTCDPTLPGVDTLHLSTIYGCDSLVITTTTLLPSVQTDLSATTCDPTLAGVDTLHLSTIYGCDSLVITTTTLLPTAQTDLSATTCDPTLAGVDTLHLSTTYGCDSLVITTTTLLPTAQTDLSATTCDPTLAGVDTLHLSTIYGCDSLVITTTTLLPSVQTDLSATTCDPTLAGVDTLHLSTIYGCDSLVITTTTLLPSVQTNVNATTCDPTLAGVDTLHLSTIYGCDSLVIITTILLPSVQTDLSATTCDAALAGVDTLHLITIYGCDSLVITTTTLLASIQTNLNATTCDPTLAGVDTLHLSTIYSCDSLVITTTTLLPSAQTNVNATTCDPTLAGVDTLHLSTTYGCDSLVIITTILLPSVQTNVNATTCDPTLAGVDTLHLSTTYGCDSLVIITTILLPSVQTNLNATTCDPSLAGVDTLHLSTTYGCDSLVITTTTLLPSVQTDLSTTTCDPTLVGVDTLHLSTVYGCDSLVITITTLMPQALISWSSEPSCPDQATGILQGAYLSGGEGPFEISIDGADFHAGLEASELNAGLHSIRIRDALGCLTDTIVTVESLPGLYLDLPDAVLPCDPGTVATLVVEVQGLVEQLTYQWSTGATQAMIEVSAPGLYSVSVRNTCQMERAEALVTRAEQAAGSPAFVPNVFAPESPVDGNRLFRPFLRSDVVPAQYRLRVYDRWGSLVYETDVQDSGWDGRTSRGVAPTGVYVWLLEMEWEQCGKMERWQAHGDVLLIR
ncbi:MAG: gliding motility-associated C-terminal domain-containing protein [Bacteroidetes bacterium]|nr:gliding motility-associated C-terminal domain-containing protein [Bacteroidota bacterium]